jgi:hypothetical protein
VRRADLNDRGTTTVKRDRRTTVTFVVTCVEDSNV